MDKLEGMKAKLKFRKQAALFSGTRNLPDSET